MLNGTMCATTRTLCCILENYQTAEGVNVPEALRPYMGGMEFLPYDQKATAAFFKAKAEEEKRAAEAAKKKGGKKGGAAKEKDAGQKKPAAAQQQPEEVKGAPKAAVQEIKFGTAVPELAQDMKDLFNALEVQLQGHQYMAGQKPGAADREAIEKIKKGSIPRPDSHPNVFAWYAMVSKIKPETRS